MVDRVQFFPAAVYSGLPADSVQPPRVFIAPHRYIQGKNIMDRLGEYLSVISSRRPAVLLSEGGRRRLGIKIGQSLAQAGIEPHVELFMGECSAEEVQRMVESIRNAAPPVDSIIAAGGGKCLDAGKCVAFRLGVPVVICPTIASTDAPCSAVSVMYTPDGVGKGPEFFPNSPALVVVDTAIIAAGPIRHFISGMGDALATFYEARTCFRNPRGRSMVGARATIAALALAELCARTVFDDGTRAVAALRRGEIDDSVERIVEANTLLSGLGFESGGLAAAHAMAAGLTVIPHLHRDYLHGELVAFSLMAHLILEHEVDEARRVARLMAELGLPVCLQQLRLDTDRDKKPLMEAMAAALKEPFAGNEPFNVTAELLFSAVCDADHLGLEIADLTRISGATNP